MNTIKIQFDGGCRPTNPGNKYGSYRIELNGKLVHQSNRVELGWGTNNEAEFEALIMALEWAHDNLGRDGYQPKDFDVHMITDSTIVRNRINGRYRGGKGEPAQRMARLCGMCREYLAKFRSDEIEWMSREVNMSTFGH